MKHILSWESFNEQLEALEYDNSSKSNKENMAKVLEEKPKPGPKPKKRRIGIEKLSNVMSNEYYLKHAHNIISHKNSQFE